MSGQVSNVSTLPIKPEECRAVMRVGTASSYQNQLCPAPDKRTPFVVEWMPDAYPASKMGEVGTRYLYDN